MRSHHFKDVESFVDRFEAPERVVWQKPAEVIGALNVSRGDRVADIGAGTGYFTIPLARAVGSKGVVFAVDAEPGMIAYIKKRIQKERAKNVQTVVAKTPPALDRLDLAFICNTYHHLEARPRYLAHLRESMKRDGRVVIIDWKKRGRMGPPASMRLSAEEVAAELKAARFELERKETFLREHYFLFFRMK